MGVPYFFAFHLPHQTEGEVGGEGATDVIRFVFIEERGDELLGIPGCQDTEDVFIIGANGGFGLVIEGFATKGGADVGEVARDDGADFAPLCGALNGLDEIIY